MRNQTPGGSVPKLTCCAGVVFRNVVLGIRNYTAFATVCCALLLSGCSTHPSRSDERRNGAEFPDAPIGERLALSLKAKGVQIYKCQAKQTNATRFEWVFKAPEADLFDHAGRKVGTHYKGPTWKHIDGSCIVGENPRAYVKDTNSIPWLVLGVKQNDGVGVFDKVTSIRRVDTVGGKAPAQGCDSSNAGKEIRVSYTAIYHFYTAKP